MKVKDERNTTQTSTNTENEDQNESTTLKGEKVEGLIKDLSRTLQRNLPDKVKCRIVKTGSKLQQNFNIKDKLEDKHRSTWWE